MDRFNQKKQSIILVCSILLLLAGLGNAHFEHTLEGHGCDIQNEGYAVQIDQQEHQRMLPDATAHAFRIKGQFPTSTNTTINITVIRKIFDVAANYLSRVLQVTTVTPGTLRYQSPYTCGITVPDNYVTSGIDQATTDSVVFIVLSVDSNASWVAGATYCQLNRWPTYGYIEFNAYYINTNLAKTGIFHRNVETTLHQMIHIYGLSSNYYSSRRPTSLFYRSYTDTTRIPLSEVVTTTATGVFMLITQNVKNYVRDYFGCVDGLTGAILEDQGGSGSAGSHWERSVYFDEVMSASVWLSGAKITGITLALLQDTGFYYSVDRTIVQNPQFGKGKGCLFAQNSISPFPEFCTSGFKVCDFYNQYGGTCSAADGFVNSKSYIRPLSGYLCAYPQLLINTTNLQFNALSRCFDGVGTDSKCFVSNCLPGGGIQIRVGGVTSICTIEGASITINGITMQCPTSFQRFCSRKGCDDWCHTDGFCVNGNCIFTQCVSIHPQCLSCSGSLCTGCSGGLVPSLNQLSCVNCGSAISSCSTCTVTSFGTQCTLCNSGLFSDSTRKSCVGCFISSCSACQVTNGITVCGTCALNTYPTQNNLNCLGCGSVIDGCSVCGIANGVTICSTCNAKYFLAGISTCTLCSSLINGCQSCSKNLVGTLQCSNCGTLYPSSDKRSCITCPNAIFNCSSCLLSLGNTQCTTCNPGFLPNLGNTLCIACSSLLSQCSLCSSNAGITQCDACNAGYYPNSARSACLSCGFSISNCSICQLNLGVTICTSCNSGYLLDPITKTCTLCSTLISNCNLCIRDSSNVVKCTDCGSTSLYPSSIGTCIGCNTTIINCSSCSVNNGITQCQTCNLGSLLSSNLLQCNTCASLIGGCIGCGYNSNGISQCNNCGTSFPSNDRRSCVVCGTSISGCLSCQLVSGRTKCISCNGSLILSSNQQNCTAVAVCKSPCATCVSGSTTSCRSCLQGFYIYGSTCYFCNSSCQTCSLRANNCTSCRSNYILYLNRCYKCSFECLSCQVYLNYCTTCRNGNIPINGYCY